jgi:hypothetical protein
VDGIVGEFLVVSTLQSSIYRPDRGLSVDGLRRPLFLEAAVASFAIGGLARFFDGSFD